MSASVKVMLSHDYCHFEIAKSTDQEVTDAEIDQMRKECMILADKAIVQYKVAKRWYMQQQNREDEHRAELRAIEAIKAKAEGDRTPNEMARLKAYADRNWNEYIKAKYGYEDEYDEYDEYDED